MKGLETGIMAEPALRAWMQESLPPRTCYAERPGRWVGEDQWPSPRIRGERMPLGADGRLGSGAPGDRAICSPLWVGLAAGEVGRYGEDAEWPTDQREDDGGSLVFVSEPLAAPVEILGAPRVELTFRADKPQALVCARLNDVAPDGRSTRVTVGLLNLTHRASHEFPEALVPGETASATVEMDDIAHAFPKGHRIAVSVSTTYWPIAWPSPELATLTVSCGESTLILPVRPPRPEDAALRPFDPPEMAAPSPVTYHETAQGTPRRVTRDLLSGRMTVDFPRWTYAKDMTDIGQSHSSSGSVVFHITDGDPLSAETRTDYQSDITRGGVRHWHHSTGRMTCDATHFIIEIDVAAGEDDREIARKVWRDRIPRDHM
jgi:predicted acyl esterase